MKKDNDVKFMLKDVKWAYTQDGVFTIPFIWNKDRTKIKLLANGRVVDLDIEKGNADKMSQQDYHNAVKNGLKKNCGIEVLSVTNTEFVISKCHNNKMKNCPIMHNYLWKKTKEEFKYGFGSSFSYVVTFIENYGYGVQDIMKLSDVFSKALQKEYNLEQSKKKELDEPSYAEF